MSRSESPEPSIHCRGQVVPLGGFDELFPRTSIDHLLSEEEQWKAKEERKEFEEVGRKLFPDELPKEADFYAAAYESVRSMIASGVGPDVIREEVLKLNDTSDPFVLVFLEAYEDVLAGRPPKKSSLDVHGEEAGGEKRGHP